ncbi:hypothetical protein ACJRO7_009920 [Eucalyptus globulus]|uniref:Cytochrome P450 n=1 Tax=Eucalyptus globulus TaxID=34317 RepID=A0ABD3LAC5_EUCGL
MDSLALAILLSLLFTALLLRSDWNRRWRLPPSPPLLPIIGNLHLLGDLPHRGLCRLSAWYGSIMSLHLGLVSTVVISSPKAARSFLGTHDSVFGSRPRSPEAKLDFYATKGLVFTEHGPYWRSVRKLFNGMRREEAGLLVASLEDMACRMILGRSTDGEHDLRQQESPELSTWPLYVPFLRPLDLQAVRRTVDKLLEKIIDDHVRDAAHHDNKHQQDFIDILLSNDEPFRNQTKFIDPCEEKYIIDQTNIEAIILDMIPGSFETSLTSIDWAFSELMRNPQVMVCLQEELETVVGLTRMVEDWTTTSSPRIHGGCVINKCFISKKSRIIMNIWAIGGDPSRFADNGIDVKGHHFKLLPFGSGHKGLKLVLAQLAHCFNWELSEGMVPSDMDMSEGFSLSVPRANHLLVVPTHRPLV